MKSGRFFPEALIKADRSDPLRCIRLIIQDSLREKQSSFHVFPFSAKNPAVRNNAPPNFRLLLFLQLFRAKQNFIKQAENACIFKPVFEILFGGYATPTKCVAFWRLALNSYLFFIVNVAAQYTSPHPSAPAPPAVNSS